ncbi:MAG: hypothetical protein GY716_22545 [bacterium]|nr:hypothetical protein [bacterium]
MKNLARIGLFLGTLATGLVLVEVVVRVFDVGPQILAVPRYGLRLTENEKLGYEIVPGSPDGSSVHNRHGMRGPDVSDAPAGGTLRIAVVGDSIAYGSGVGPAETFSARLEALLTRVYAADPRYEVLNFGVTGYNMGQVTEAIEARVLAFRPDVILYAYCLNDAQAYSQEIDLLLRAIPDAQREYLAESRGGSLLNGASRSMLQRSRAFLLARYLVRSRSSTNATPERLALEDDPQFATDDAAAYYRELHDGVEQRRRFGRHADRIAALSTRHEIPIAVAIFPLLENLETYPLTALHRSLTTEFEDRGLATLDLLDPYRDIVAKSIELRELQAQQPFGPDILHPSATGHELAAVAIWRFLMDHGWVRRPTDEERLRLMTDQRR